MQITINGIIITEENINKSIDTEDNTPLHYAIKWFWKETIKELLKIPNININKHNYEGYTPLHDAINKNDYTKTKLLLEQPNINVNCFGNYKVNPPLIFCCSSNRYYEILKLLLQHKNIDINIENSIKYTPLHWAIYNNSWDLVEILLKDIRIYPSLFKKNIYNETPIDIAKRRVNKYNIKVFEEYIPFSPVCFEEIQKLWN